MSDDSPRRFKVVPREALDGVLGRAPVKAERTPDEHVRALLKKSERLIETFDAVLRPQRKECEACARVFWTPKGRTIVRICVKCRTTRNEVCAGTEQRPCPDHCRPSNGAFTVAKVIRRRGTAWRCNSCGATWARSRMSAEERRTKFTHFTDTATRSRGARKAAAKLKQTLSQMTPQELMARVAKAIAVRIANQATRRANAAKRAAEQEPKPATKSDATSPGRPRSKRSGR